MYFLAKNIRTCSKTFRGAPDKVQLYKDGVLNWEYLAKTISYFISHPEQLKQKLKERDAHMLCQFFDSEEYKSRVSQFLETQGKILANDTITGMKRAGTIKYQHVLSCAQPAHKKLFMVEREPSEINSREDLKKKKVKKCTIFDEIIKKKGRLEIREDSACACYKPEIKVKKQKTRSTIMPIFLKKIKQRREENAQILQQEAELNDISLHYQTARRIKAIGDEDSEPLYAQILLRKNVQQNSRALAQKQSQSSKLSKTESKYSKVASKKETEPSNKVAKDPSILEHSTNSSRHYVSAPKMNENHKFSDKTTVNKPKNVSSAPLKLGGPSNVIPLRMASSTAKIASRIPTLQLCPKKNMNLKSYSDFLCIEPKKPQKIKNKKCDDDENSVKIDIFKSDKTNPKKKKSSNSMLMESALKSRSLKSLKLEDNFEKRNTMMKILENNKRKTQKRKRNEIVLLSLFKKVKLGTSQNASVGSLCKTNKTIPQNQLLKAKKSETLKEPNKPNNEQSFTYKIVAKNRERRVAKLKEKFQLNPPYWQNKFSFSFGKHVEPPSSGNLIGISVKNQDQKLEVVAKNIAKNLHRPVPHFVDYVNKPKLVEFNQFSGYKLNRGF